MIRRAITGVCLFAILFQSHIAVNACGPSFLQPVFVFEDSPDLPFEEFAAGKIGIVKPTFGRKTLVISYRYLNGASFTADEQTQLVLALQARSSGDDGREALQAWIALRKEVTPNEELPEIYRERPTPWGYDYFPNCAKNAFEVAVSTLKARVASYGADDRNVHEWMRGQDQVFQNCSGSSPVIPVELNQAVPQWLRKDRDYQIAAALFYSMQFDEAVARFAKIAGDAESGWQATADYLVARTRVRYASLTEDQEKRSNLYAAAEEHLQKLTAGNNQFREASRKLLGLVKFRIRPQERLAELAEIVSRPGASLDVRQDLIDYVWLVDKFEAEVLKAEHDRREALKPKEHPEKLSPFLLARRTDQEDFENTVTVSYLPRFVDGTPDYPSMASIRVRYDHPLTEIIRLLEERANRSLTEEEQKQIQTQVETSIAYRRWSASNNIKLARITQTYEVVTTAMTSN